MLDGVEVVQAMQRTRGRAAVRLVHDAGRVRLVDLHQSGSAKVFLPRSHTETPEIVFLNTAGGLTGGDRMRFSADLGPGARATATTQTAERIYASTGATAEVDISLSVGAGGRLDWLPQETILFDRARLARRTEVALAGDAACLWVETLVLGRAAMGEALADVQARDHRVVTRDGRPVLIEPAGISPALLADAGQPAGLDGARALATLALVAPGAEDAVGPLRAALKTADGVRGAVTGWDGKAIVRLMAADAYPLRKALAGLLSVLRPGPLPRVWQI